MLKKLNKKGFTLAELLIVVAIIGVLVAISIPIFTAQLEKAREATDEANIRSAYAVIVADSLAPDEDIANNNTDKIAYTKATVDAAGNITTPASAEVTLVQTQDGWSGSVTPSIGGATAPTGVGAGKKVTVTINKDTGVPTLTVA